jgi:hypothetical protein
MNATHEYKQVGRNCLADFIGFDPHAAAEMAEMLAGIGAFAGACEDDGEERGPRERFYRVIGEYLPYVAMFIRTNGWLSNGKAWEMGDKGLSTSNSAWNQMIENEIKARRGEKVEPRLMPSEAHVAVASKTVTYIADLFEDADVAGLSDYEHNLRVAMMAGVVEARTAGIIASSINFASRDQEKKAEKVDFSNSQFVGTIGQRAVFTGLKCVFPGFGGRPVVFVDAAGNKVSAWNPGFACEKGMTYTVKATPTKQDEYKGVKSTMMNRMVLATEKDLAPKAPRKPRAKKVVETGPCEHCRVWAATGRPCTVASHGECDCPKCQGMCVCK